LHEHVFEQSSLIGLARLGAERGGVGFFFFAVPIRVQSAAAAARGVAKIRRFLTE
jgi:hypothetical protein